MKVNEISERSDQIKSLIKEMDLENAARKYRRDLHQIPELGLETPLTIEYCKNALKDTDFEVIDEVNGVSLESGFLAFLDAEKKESIAFRTDMDALPVKEPDGKDFKSRFEGRMHACGHDGHMAIALSLARLLGVLKNDLEYNVVLIFQNGEETSGGADLLSLSGFFEKYHVIEVFGQHLWPTRAAGSISTRPLELMARTSEVHVTITGKSVHAALYKEGTDPIEAGALFISELYEYERSIPNSIFRLLRFGMFQAGTANNVIPGTAFLSGTLRAFQDEIFDEMVEQVKSTARNISQKTGAVFDIEFSQGYPAVMNDPELAARILKVFDFVELLDQPEMIAEDFSYYQKRVPGVFFFLGTGTHAALHNEKFDFDESILMSMLPMYALIAQGALSDGQ